MKRIVPVLVLLLSACGHYSQDLAALDKKIGADPAPIQMASANGDLNAIETASGPGLYYEDFNQVLARDYYKLAREENDQAMDYRAAQYYTEKAKAANLGKPVMPGKPAQFDIPEDQKGELEGARATLINALQFQREPQTEATLAEAVVCYDCWLDQVEEGKTGVAATCAESFNQAMNRLTGAMDGQQGSLVRISVPFIAGQPALASDARAKFSQILTALQNAPAGSKLYIQAGADDLSQARAAAVRSVLQYNGVDPDKVADQAYPVAAPAAVQNDVLDVIVQMAAPAQPGV